jgi:uncharacterized protein YdbL (DUF1318 family)
MKMKTHRIAFPLAFSAARIALSASFVAVSAVSCVTVNVNFPEATVQKATDDYVRDLYKAKDKKGANPQQGDSSSNKPSATAPAATKTTTSLLESLFVSTAYADEINFKVNSPKAMTIRDRQIKRIDTVHDAKVAGQLGETGDGYLAIDPKNTLKPLLKKSLEKSLQPLVDAENKDRKDLYQEILASNGFPKSRLKDLEKSFARSFQGQSPSGTWVQDAQGQWSQKP